MAKLTEAQKRAARKAIEFGVRYGTTNASVQASVGNKQIARKLLALNIALGAHYLSSHDNYQELMELIAYHWHDTEAKLDPADIASEDEGEMALLNTARALSIYGFDPATALSYLTAEGKEALALYKAIRNESGSLE